MAPPTNQMVMQVTRAHYSPVSWQSDVSAATINDADNRKTLWDSLLRKLPENIPAPSPCGGRAVQDIAALAPRKLIRGRSGDALRRLQL
jgi:hypothetical protein